MWKRTSRGIALVLVVIMLVALLPISAALADATIVLVNPPSQSVNLNSTVTVEVKVDQVTNLYGLEFRLTFDATKLEAQDANTSLSGVQIEPGTFLNPAQGFMAQNVADNATGQVQYAFTLLSPTPAVSGTGVLAKITFRAKAAGNALIRLDSVKLSNDQVQPITATSMDGSITVVGAPGPTAVPPTPTRTRTPVPGATPVPPLPCAGFPYTVQWGDTVSAIARRFGTTTAAIVSCNNLADANRIRIGQVLTIPAAQPPPPPGPITYVVQKGDTLYGISRKFGVSLDAIVALNKIVNPWYIRVGQVLLIPTGGPPPPPPARTYVVQRGDTIYGIAARYGVTAWSIITLNNLANPNLIFVGQTLLIP